MVIASEDLAKTSFADLFLDFVSVGNVVLCIGNILTFLIVKTKVVLCRWRIILQRELAISRYIDIVNCLEILNFLFFIVR